MAVLILIPAVNAVIYYGFVKDTRVPVRMISAEERIAYGDLSRLSHLNGLRRYVILANKDSREYVANTALRSFPVYTIGDSYTDYRDYPTRIANLLSRELKTNVYNMTGQTVGAMMDFLVGDTISGSARPQFVVWEVVERTASSNHMSLQNFDSMYADAMKRKKQVKTGRVFSPNEEVSPSFSYYKIQSSKKTHKWYDFRSRLDDWKANDSPFYAINLDFMLNNISFYATGKLIRGTSLVNVAYLKSGEPLLYYENERSGFIYGHENAKQTADFVARVNGMLKEKGIQLIFYVVPDKYNVYYPQFEDRYRKYEDRDFMGKLTVELEKQGVATFNLLPQFREQAQEERGELYISDDSHWDMGGKRIAVHNIKLKLEELGFPL